MVTVCMTTYKGEKYREEQLSSIEKNIMIGDEVIVSEDGNDKAFLESLKKRGEQFKPLEGPGCGAAANFEYALSHAAGDIIFLADQDDIWTEDKVSQVMKIFNAYPMCMMVVHDADLIDGDGKPIGDSFFEIRDSKSGIVKNIMKNSYIGCCMAFRRELLNYALPFPTSGTLHDQWLGLIAEQVGPVVFVSDKFVHYRRHDDNVSGMQHLPVMKMVSNRVSLCWNLLKRKLRGPQKYQAYTLEEVRARWKR